MKKSISATLIFRPYVAVGLILKALHTSFYKSPRSGWHFILIYSSNHSLWVTTRFLTQFLKIRVTLIWSTYLKCILVIETKTKKFTKNFWKFFTLCLSINKKFRLRQRHKMKDFYLQLNLNKGQFLMGT